MNFGDGALLILLVAMPLAMGMGLWTLRWRARQAERMVRLGGGDVVRSSDARSRLLWLMTLSLALLLLALASARPQIGARETEVQQTGVAVAVALDVSLSMGARDVDPSRLSSAQSEIGHLLSRLPGDRVGLVLFAGNAFVRFPLTRDMHTARKIINALRPGEGFVTAGTDIRAAIEAALSLLEKSDAATRAILIVSDGESLRGDALLAANAAVATGVRVFSAGVGTSAGSTILVESSVRNSGSLTPQIDRNTGQPIISRADFASLQALADAGRGRFAALGRPGSLSALADDFDALASTTFAVTLQRNPIARFQIFTALALVLLVLEPLLSPGLRRRRLRRRGQSVTLSLVVMAIGLIASSCASNAFSHNERGNARYAEGSYAAALGEYRQAQADEPSERRLNINAGRALHRLGEFDRAASESGQGTQSSDARLAASAFFNLGNHRVAVGDLLAARNAYIESLLLNPSDIDAKFNLELVNAALMTLQPPPHNPTGARTGDIRDSNVEDSGTGGQPRQQDNSDPPDSRARTDGNPPSIQGEGGARAVSGNSGPDGLTETQPETKDAFTLTAMEALQQALSNLDRNAPTREQALAILDALRSRLPRELLSLGQHTPIEIDPEDR